TQTFFRDAPAAGERRLVPALKRLGMEILCSALLGFAPGPALDLMLADYDRVMPGFVSIPLPLPGATYFRARRALARVLAAHRATIASHGARLELGGPHENRPPAPDGLDRMLMARADAGSAGAFDDAALAVECHHLLAAGMIVWAHFASAL